MCAEEETTGQPQDEAAPEAAGDEYERDSTLLRLLERHSARALLKTPSEDAGLAEHLPYPFLALVGQVEMRMALLLAVINPNVGGVLLIGPRGTGKTTAVRGLSHLLPHVEVSRCYYGCMPEDWEVEGPEGVCPDCAAKMAEGEPITRMDPVRLIELPLNARLEDVVGGIDERIAIQQQRVRLNRGILSQADRNILYIDEVNLLDDAITDAILDAASQGSYTVRRGPMAATYRSRFILIGSMNPEEGHLRPQIADRFGLRVLVRGLSEPDDRLEVYNRVLAFRRNPRAFVYSHMEETFMARADVIGARELLPEVVLEPDVKTLGLRLVQELEIDSHRAEFTMFEAARAYAAADGRSVATVDDLKVIAPLALRQRRSKFMDDFFEAQGVEDEQVTSLLQELNG
jgi:magnesium chelatase subunit I